jgi:hypothetical protein
VKCLAWLKYLVETLWREYLVVGIFGGEYLVVNIWKEYLNFDGRNM